MFNNTKEINTVEIIVVFTWGMVFKNGRISAAVQCRQGGRREHEMDGLYDTVDGKQEGAGDGTVRATARITVHVARTK